MLQNHQLQGLIVEDQAVLGMMNMGFFSNPNSTLPPFVPHHDLDHHQLISSSHVHHQHQQQSLKYNSFAASMISYSIPGGDDADVEDDDNDDTHDHHHYHGGASSNNSNSDLCQQALLMSSSCAHNPKPRDLHQDTYPLSLQSSNPSNPWEWRSSGREAMVSERLFDRDNESAEDHDHTIDGNNVNYNEKNGLGVSALRMKKMKAGRRKVREPRFCFKTLSNVDVLNDGYKWRKYGQKVVKNTQHPRSYYRCTQDNCRVKKRVERLAEDPRMVITTYEGRHVHSPSHDNPDEDSSRTQPFLNNFFR